MDLLFSILSKAAPLKETAFTPVDASKLKIVSIDVYEKRQQTYFFMVQYTLMRCNIMTP